MPRLASGVLDCGGYRVSDPRCTPDRMHVYPIELGGHPLGGTIGGGQTREWRLNPDGVHLGWNTAVVSNSTYDEFGSVGRLEFDRTGGRYNLTHVALLYNGAPRYQPYVVGHGNRLRFNEDLPKLGT